MPVGGLCAVIFAGWVLKKPEISDELTSGGTVKLKKTAIEVIFFLIRYVSPIAVIAIMLGAWL